jgi:hypothetical protein
MAREAFWSSGNKAIAESAQKTTPVETHLELAIESATRVHVTGNVFDAAYRAYDDSGDPHSSAIGAAVRAAFEAAGYEVVE